MALKELKGHDAFYLAIQSMLRKSYGIKVDCIKEFYSFEDRNYYIQGSVKVAEALPETEFTLKIMNAEVSQNPGRQYSLNYGCSNILKNVSKKFGVLFELVSRPKLQYLNNKAVLIVTSIGCKVN